MKKEITFGGFTAILNASDTRAMLVITDNHLPAELADKINESGDLDILEVFLNDDKQGCVRISHDLPMADLTDIICNAISAIYNTDISISNAKTESVI